VKKFKKTIKYIQPVKIWPIRTYYEFNILALVVAFLRISNVSEMVLKFVKIQAQIPFFTILITK
jgi:hypothetical protein